MTDITQLDIRDFDGLDFGVGHNRDLFDKVNELVVAMNAAGDVAFPPVADLAALKAIAATDLEDKMLVLCETLGLYRYDSASVATADDVGVVQPTAVTGAGRFLRIYKNLMPIAETGRLYVDATLGSDTTGDGSINKPLASIAAAVTAASAGNSIQIAPGTYTGTTGTLTVAKMLNLFARGVTLDGALVMNAACYVEGLTTTGAVTDSAGASYKDCALGSTLEVSGASSILVDTVTVTGAITLSSTGGIWGRNLTAADALTGTGGGGLNLYASSVAGALDLSGGACNTMLFGCGLAAATFTGTSSFRAVNTTASGNVAAEDGEVVFRGGALAGDLTVTGDCHCAVTECPIGGAASTAGAVAILALFNSDVTGAVSMAGAGDTLVADRSNFASTLALGDGTGIVALRNMGVTGAVTVTTTLTSLLVRDVAFADAFTSSAGAGLDMAGGSFGGAVDLSGGACGSYFSKVAFLDAFTFTGTGVCRVVDCSIAGAYLHDGTGAASVVYLIRTGLASTLTVDGGAGAGDSPTTYAIQCSIVGNIEANAAGAPGSYASLYANECQCSGNVSETGGVVLMRDCYWLAAPVFTSNTLFIELNSTSAVGALMAGGAGLTGTPFVCAGGSLVVKGYRIDHSGDTAILDFSAGGVSFYDCEIDGDRVTSLMTPTGGDQIDFVRCILRNNNADDAPFAVLDAVGEARLYDSQILRGTVSVDGMDFYVRNFTMHDPGACALLGTPANTYAENRSHRCIGVVAAPANLIAQFAGGGGAWDDAVGPFNLVGPFYPVRSVQIVASGGATPGAFTVTGTDATGRVISESGTTVAGAAVATNRHFATVTRIEATDPGGGQTLDLQSGPGVHVGWDVFDVFAEGIDGDDAGGPGNFDLESRTYTLNAGGSAPAGEVFTAEVGV